MHTRDCTYVAHLTADSADHHSSSRITGSTTHTRHATGGGVMPASETGPLTPDQVAAYLTDGILVVADLLTKDELKTARAGLADTLRDGFGVDVDDLDGTAGGIVDASTTNGA
ncbi:hypothetical protein THAOC_27481, partial [Thalassiosira oceanica]